MAAAIKALNLVFVMFDDLRPELSIYKREHMVTPNFERLANRSVVFDKSFCQVAVCNPSRDSLLTGLRPDTVGTYAFQSMYMPHLPLPRQLVQSGYSTAAFGKIFHWEMSDKSIWSDELYTNDWYEYQNTERAFMNSSTLPDKILKIEEFRDYDYTSRAIARLKLMINEYKKTSKPYMLSIGYKLPHLAVHVPYYYYEIYKNKTDAFILNKYERMFPHSSPDVSFRCCAEGQFYYMEQEGAIKSKKSENLGNINFIFNQKMYTELMLGYCAGVSFVDSQLGRILDVMDEAEAWDNTVFVLTADHGMHNGEKGIWEKWSLFDESARYRLPLLIRYILRHIYPSFLTLSCCIECL